MIFAKRLAIQCIVEKLPREEAIQCIMESFAMDKQEANTAHSTTSKIVTNFIVAMNWEDGTFYMEGKDFFTRITPNILKTLGPDLQEQIQEAIKKIENR